MKRNPQRFITPTPFAPGSAIPSRPPGNSHREPVQIGSRGACRALLRQIVLFGWGASDMKVTRVYDDANASAVVAPCQAEIEHAVPPLRLPVRATITTGWRSGAIFLKGTTS